MKSSFLAPHFFLALVAGCQALVCATLAIFANPLLAWQVSEPGQTNSRQVEGNAIDPLQTLQLTSQAFRLAVDRIKPSMVTIESFGGVRTQQGQIGGIRNQGEGPTTGVLISADGYILTSSFNFIQSQPVITVITSDGQRHIARLIGRDDTRKICLVKIDPVNDIPLPEIVPESEIRVGQWAISAGIGYGDAEPAISTGIISAKNRIGGKAVQTDANISPANYGGPLLDIRGRLVGICVPLNPQSQAVGAGVEWYDSGIGFAIPLDGNQELIERLKQGQRIRPAFLGVQVTASVEANEANGVLIVEVVPNSPAAQAGLQVNDIITQLDGQPIVDLMNLKQAINRLESGRQIELRVIKASTVQPADRTQQESQQESAEQQESAQSASLPAVQRRDAIRTVTVQVELAQPPPAQGEIDPLEPPKIR